MAKLITINQTLIYAPVHRQQWYQSSTVNMLTQLTWAAFSISVLAFWQFLKQCNYISSPRGIIFHMHYVDWKLKDLKYFLAPYLIKIIIIKNQVWKFRETILPIEIQCENTPSFYIHGLICWISSGKWQAKVLLSDLLSAEEIVFHSSVLYRWQ